MCEPCKNDCHAKDMEHMNRLNDELRKGLALAEELVADCCDCLNRNSFWKKYKEQQTEKRKCGFPKHMTGEPCELPSPCPNHGGPVSA